MGICEKIADIEAEIARTQKNKATEHHMGMLKAKLAKLRSELIEADSSGSGPKVEGFESKRVASNHARVTLIGFPSTGKSTLLNKMTGAQSYVSEVEFSTLTAMSASYSYNGAKIEMRDMPGIIEGASSGRGRGKQVIAAARNSDTIIMMLDASRGDAHRKLLTHELEACRIRLNKTKPNISFKVKKTGGFKFTATCPLSHLSEKLVYDICKDDKVFNVEIVVREDATVDDFLDVMRPNVVYMPCLYVYNKIDNICLEDVDRLARMPHSCVISCELNLNLDELKRKIWDHLEICRIYTKKRGERPSLEDPLILKKGATVEEVCRQIHKDMVKTFKYALVWGTSTAHNPQRVGLRFGVDDEDVVQVTAG